MHLRTNKIQFPRIPFIYSNINFIYREVLYRSVDSEGLWKCFKVVLKNFTAYHLMTMELYANTYSDKKLPRAMDASQPSDTEDIPQQAEIMQKEEKEHPLVNLSLTIDMSHTC